MYLCMFYVCVCLEGAIWIVHDFKQWDCILQVCKQYVNQQLYPLKVCKLWLPSLYIKQVFINIIAEFESDISEIINNILWAQNMSMQL